MNQFLIITFAIISTLNFATAQFKFDNPPVLKVESLLSQDKLRPGDEFKIGVKVTIFDNWHINSNKPAEEFLIPTRVTFEQIDGIDFGAIRYPEGESIKFAFSETPLAVYADEILIWATAKVKDAAKPNQVTIRGKLSYQACNDVSCLMPTDEVFENSTFIAPKDTEIKIINAAAFKFGETELGALKGERAVNEIAALLSGKGLALTLLFIFIGGLALNLTPCVYPVIPITISFFVGQASGKISKSFLLALIYVSGMAITYSLLGVTAALTGGLLGSSLQNPLVLIAIAMVFLIFAASMFGAFEITIPAFLNTLAGGSRQGVIGSLFMGLTVGIVAAPCIGPFVISLLTYVAAQGDPLLGFLMFFILAMGLGLPYLVLGTFSGSIKNLPRSGEWMIWVKKVFGVIMIAVAIYFVNTLLPELLYTALLTATFLLGGIFVGFIDKARASFNWFKGLKLTIGIVFILVSVWLVYSQWQERNLPHVNWQTYDEVVLQQPGSKGKPVLIDFYADWCLPCKQIDKNLFTNPDIVNESESFVALKADLTKENSDAIKNLRKEYHILGVPTVVLINADGVEYRRFTDELIDIAPAEFLKIMQQALGKGLME